MTSKLDYWRADNMWAAAGRPDGELGQETVSLDGASRRVFVTDWRYEKRRNDGTNFYGSHGRRLTNSGTTDLYVRLAGGRDGATPQQYVGALINGGFVARLPAGTTVAIKNDIAEVTTEAPAGIKRP